MFNTFLKKNKNSKLSLRRKRAKMTMQLVTKYAQIWTHSVSQHNKLKLTRCLMSWFIFYNSDTLRNEQQYFSSLCFCNKQGRTDYITTAGPNACDVCYLPTGEHENISLRYRYDAIDSPQFLSWHTAGLRNMYIGNRSYIRLYATFSGNFRTIKQMCIRDSPTRGPNGTEKRTL